jgi:hypothetical protein
MVTQYATSPFFEYPTGNRSVWEDRPLFSWQDDYIAALAETDPEKQRQYVYRAKAALEQRRLSPLEPGSEEYEAIERAEKALEILKKSLSEG